MRVVSLNLDLGDATVVRRALRKALDECTCSRHNGQSLCADCLALAATMAELDRFVQRPALGRTHLMTLGASGGKPLGPNGSACDAVADASRATRLRLVSGDDALSGRP